MPDTLTPQQRSYCMSKIKSKNTSLELRLKKSLHNFEYQPKIFGNPDFIYFKKKIVLFIDGCFWHMCPKHFIKPKTNKSYWMPKLKRNVVRDKEIRIAYKIAGWKVISVWEHELNKH